MNELDEVPMTGTPDNDYTFGDYVCRCHRCGADYYGPDGLLVCHECFIDVMGKPDSNCSLWVMLYLFGLGLAVWSIYQLI
jgi:hypothetical protein